MLTPDLKQNFFTTIYLLFTHNYIAFAYFTGAILSVVLSLLRPSRFTIFMMLGFLILLFSFEYDKHIIEGLREQTINSLITINPHYRLSRIINVVISEILPVFFYILGWIFVYLGIIAGAFLKEKKSDQAK